MTTLEELKGIVAIEYALPTYYIPQEDIAKHLKVDPNKLKIGLGLQEIGVPSSNQDVVSLAMTAVHNLITKNNIDISKVGRLEVGTESNFDGSKAIKTYLMDLFPGNNTICGIDTTNACYGGTNALLNAINWIHSPFWDGRYAIVVSTDIASYLNDESAIPTAGAGAVAILLGNDPVFVFENEMSHYSSNEKDFLKPKDCYPYPVMDGRLSVDKYLTAFQECYSEIKKRIHDNFDYICFHNPFPKLPQKICKSYNISEDKLRMSNLIAQRNGNSYTPSLYFSFLSLLYNAKEKLKINQKVLMFSYGAGCMASIFILRKVKQGCICEDLEERLDKRQKMNIDEYFKRLKDGINLKDYEPNDSVCVNGFYLEKIENYFRYYRYFNKTVIQ